MCARVPSDFFGEDDLGVDDRRSFPITGAQIETNPAAIEMASERSGDLVRRREAFGRGETKFERALINLLHDRSVEVARWRLMIILLEPRAQVRRSREMDFI